MITAGVLSLQGDVSEQVSHTKAAMHDLNLDGCVLEVKVKKEFKDINALIIPGGESTTIGKLLKEYGLGEEIKKLARKNIPVMGTCAGLIMLGKDTNNANALGLMDMEAERNAFGRQKESFEVDINIPRIGETPYHAVFIRAPVIKKPSEKIEILAEYKNKVVMAQENNLLAVAFHPELTEDLRVHKYFLELIKR